MGAVPAMPESFSRALLRGEQLIVGGRRRVVEVIGVVLAVAQEVTAAGESVH